MGFRATLNFKSLRKDLKLVLLGESIKITLYCDITVYTISFDTAA